MTSFRQIRKLVNTNVLLVLVCASGFTTQAAIAASAEEQAQAAIDTRQGLLKVLVSYFGPIYGMAKDQIPYDAQVVKTNAEHIASLASMLPDVFRMDTTDYDGETEALDDIWDNSDDYTDKSLALVDRANALAAASAQNEGAAMKAFGAMGASCKACHDNYRQQQ